MNLNPLLEHISSAGHFAKVAYATQMDYVGNSEEDKTLPAVFLHLFQEKAMPNEYLGVQRQEVDVFIAFKVVCKNKELHSHRDALRDSLLGHQLEGAISPMEYVGGEVADVVKSVIWWRDIYKVTVLKQALS